MRGESEGWEGDMKCTARVGWNKRSFSLGYGLLGNVQVCPKIIGWKQGALKPL